MPTDTTQIDWVHGVPDQLDWLWQTQARPRLVGLTDEEYLWEPVAGSWSVRRSGGRAVLDWADPPPRPAPVTTIAWRLAHVTVGCLGERTALHFGGPPVSWDDYDAPLDAASALHQLDAAYAGWRDGVAALGAEGMARPCGPQEGVPDAPLGFLVLHINREVIHHLAEVALLRDLWAHREGLTG